MNIDIKAGRVTLSHLERSTAVRGRAVSLLCMLVVEEGRLVTADEVHNLPGWNSISRESVGKQVARIIDELDAKSLNPIVWRNKTNGWQLAPEVAADVNPQTKFAARDWLMCRGWGQGYRFSNVPPPVIAEWAIAASKAAVTMTQGHIEQGWEDLRLAYSASDHPDLKAIADLIATRLGQRMARPHAPVQREGAARSAFELAVEGQRMAAYAIQSASNTWSLQVVELRALLPELSAAGCLVTQAYVHNALALLLRRLGEHQAALCHAAEAAPIAVFSGDIALMQAVLFNFGNIASELRRKDPASVPEGLAINLIEADLAIRRRLGVGMDSAQAELLLAYLAYEEGSLERAEAYLQCARDVIAVSNFPADHALEMRVSGLLRLARNDEHGLAMLDRAISLFEGIGNTAAANHVRGERISFGRQ